ncbi:MAG: putative sulfate exporter family transporter [Microbacteriaceae bacterium]|nr:putative sulfate exporter family transporter [Microbacteriaceae bacterium]
MTGSGVRALLPGLAAAASAVLVAWILHLALPWLPLLTAAVVLGIVVGQLPWLAPALDHALKPGIRFSAKTLIRAGVVLLGLKLSLGDIASLGAVAILAIVALVIVTFFGTWALGILMRLPGSEPLLVAAGFSICGASAIGAMSAATRSNPEEQATPVALVTLCGTLAIAVLPALQGPLGLSNAEFGHWVGASVHDVGQVVATAQTAGSAALAIAVVVKLTRVLMLAPMVTVASVAVRRREAVAAASARREARTAPADAAVPASADAAVPASADEAVPASANAAALTPADADSRPVENSRGRAVPAARIPIIPLFVLGFLATVLLNSVVSLPEPVLAGADAAQTVLLAAALFALGTSVRIHSLIRTGWRALIVGLASWMLIAVLAYALIRL